MLTWLKDAFRRLRLTVAVLILPSGMDAIKLLLEHAAERDRLMMRYRRYFDQRAEDRKKLLAFYRSLLSLALPHFIHREIEVVIRDLSSFPIGAYSPWPVEEAELNFATEKPEDAERHRQEAKARARQNAERRLLRCLSDLLARKTTEAAPP